MSIKTMPELRDAIRDHRVIRFLRIFEEEAPREDLIAKDWELAIIMAERITGGEKEQHLRRMLETSMARVAAWSILNPGRVPK